MNIPTRVTIIDTIMSILYRVSNRSSATNIKKLPLPHGCEMKSKYLITERKLHSLASIKRASGIRKIVMT